MIRLENVSKTYKNNEVLKNINLNLDRGKIIGLVGPNGSGKTTMMKIISGLITNYQGNIKNPSTVGFLIENPKVFENKSGKYNIDYFNQVGGKKSNPKEIIEKFQMKEYINKRVSKYSLGMKQRLGVALAMLSDPEFLILDEPTNGLDPASNRALKRVLKDLADENRGIFISSHNLNDIEHMCDTIYLLKNGTLIDIQKQSATDVVISFKPRDMKKIRLRLDEHIDYKLEGVNEIRIVEAKQEEILQVLAKENIFPSKIRKGNTLEDKYFQLTKSV